MPHLALVAPSLLDGLLQLSKQGNAGGRDTRVGASVRGMRDAEMAAFPHGCISQACVKVLQQVVAGSVCRHGLLQGICPPHAPVLMLASS